MKIHCVFTIFLLFLSPLFADEKQEEVKITPEIAMKALDRLLSNPPAEELKPLGSIIANFASESDKVTINISMELLPWLQVDGVADKYPSLLAAYIGGNMYQQLHTGKKQDSPLYGIIAVQKLYNNIKKNDPSTEIKVLDKWEKMDPLEILKSVKETKKSNKTQ